MNKFTKLFREKTSKELLTETQSLREEVAKLQLSFKGNPPKDTNLLMKKRKQLAILLTVITEKKEIENLKK